MSIQPVHLHNFDDRLWERHVRYWLHATQVSLNNLRGKSKVSCFFLFQMFVADINGILYVVVFCEPM